MIVTVLGSGSAGNCTYIDTGRTRVLVDVGFGPRSLARRMREAGVAESIDAVLLTHAHSDHSSGVLPLLTRRDVPLFLTEGTCEELRLAKPLLRSKALQPGGGFLIGDLEVESFPVSHDSLQPVGFRFHCRGVWGAVVTDLGEMSEEAAARLEGCRWLILESNHDTDLLKIGPYPWALKQRVLSRTGHLSNQELARFLADRFNGSAEDIFLAHLSRTNNEPRLALETARRALERHRRSSARHCRLHLTRQEGPSIVLSL